MGGAKLVGLIAQCFTNTNLTGTSFTGRRDMGTGGGKGGQGV